MPEKIAFVGLGIMGQPMASNLLKAGYEVFAFDVQDALVEQAVANGAFRANSPGDAASRADMAITMLPETSIVEKVILGEDGVLSGLRPGGIVADMSTTSIIATRKIAAKVAEAGRVMLDAPVSGGDVGAKEGSLSIMVGGSAEAFEKFLPVFQKMGRNITHVGDSGSGQIAKGCNQVVVALTIEAVAEALVFAKKSGADPAKIRQAMLGGFAQSRVLELHGRRMLERNFVPGGKVHLHKKDIDIVLEVAKEVGAYMPGSAMIYQIWNSLAALGGLNWDHSAVVRAIEMLSNVEL